MSVFSEKAIAEMATEYQSIFEKHDKQLLAFTMHGFIHERAKEFAQHGFMRRLKMLVRCIENVFKLLPPENEDKPNKEDIADATMALQTFVINVYGCIDNLAWVLVHECQIKQEDGKELPYTWVGLGKGNAFLRQAISGELSKHLESLDEWFDNLENYRHSLAHRIPLYIPPYIVFEKDEAEYNELEIKKNDASVQGAYDEWNTLKENQDALGTFRPVMGQSFYEKNRPVLFHPQMLADYNTIDELAGMIMKELKG